MLRKLWPFILLVLCAAAAPRAAGQASAPLLRRYFDAPSPPRIQAIPNALAAMPAVGSTVLLSEQAALELALQSNFDINVERHLPLLAREELQRQKGPFDPVGRFVLFHDRLSSPATSIFAGGPELTEIRTQYDFSYRQDFKTGSGVELRGGGNRFRTTNLFFNLIPAVTTNFEIVLRQQLLQGFGKAPGRYRLRIARNDLTISEEEFRRRATDVILQVQNSYWELVFAAEDIKVKEKSYELATATLQQSRDRLEFGTGSRLELIQSEAELAAREEELIRSRYNQRRAQDQLVRLISTFQDPREFLPDLRPSSPLDLPAAGGKDFQQIFDLARQSRPELKQTDLEIRNRAIELEQARDQLKPRLELQAGYRQVGLGGNLVVRDFSGGFLNPQVVRIVPGGLAESLRQLFSGDFGGYTFGLALSFPVFNHAARAESAKAAVELNRTQLRKESLEQFIALEVRDALTLMDMHRARLSAAQAAVRAGRERLEGEQVRFTEGISTTRELIEAQRDLLAAESLEVRARVDLIKSQRQLDRASGMTFANNRIDLEEAVKQNVAGQ